LRESGIVSLHDRINIEVVETPRYWRNQYPVALYVMPSNFDLRAKGIFYVTPIHRREDSYEHNYWLIDNLVAHEGVPGHHLQSSLEVINGTTTPRLCSSSAFNFEAWAVYCEQLVVEQGINTTDEHRFWMLRERLVRAIRPEIDIGLQVKGYSYKSVKRILRTKAFLQSEAAENEINWYMEIPVTATAYIIGWDLLNKTRDAVKQKLKSDFDLRDFHDTFLHQGTIPLPLAVERAFGRKVYNAVFNGH